MDLKTINVSVTSDIGNIEGTALDLVIELREAALSDSLNMIEQDLNIDSADFVDTEEEFVEDVFLEDDGEEESYEREPLEEVVDSTETSDENVDVDYSLLYNTNIGINLEKFASLIKEFDNIIKSNGIVADSVTVTSIINRFKELDGVFNTYGDFVVTTSFTTL
ncbi:hypothetical protein [Mammaliicoccus sciuri]|uniref:hypothetical protein n=1 Tax=Mammaliicoccus sciuri TaxID=1296 RepID=UPI002DB6C559|nr:hypothetical protein [Mammaliicoccus sciuri]MEB6232578.1 hypothetical protein [Mammaliicoccus sciuri]